METEKKFGALTSSVDPQEFSLTVASTLKIVGTVVGGALALKGIQWSISSDQISQLADAFTVVATSAIAIWHAGQLIYGLVRKIAVKQ